MARPRKVDRLEPEMRDLIVTMRASGSTLDEILSGLRGRGADIGRTALSRHLRTLVRRPRELKIAAIEATIAALDRRVARLEDIAQERGRRAEDA